MQFVRGRRTPGPSVAALLGLVTSLALAGSARAEPEFPSHLRQNLDLPCDPPCTLCHTDPAGGAAHLNSKYGNFLAATTALGATLPLDKDADGDGVADGEELKTGTNPILPGPIPLCIETPEYGCGVGVAATPQDGGVAPEAWAFGTLALGAFARFTLRRRARARAAK